MSRITNYDEVAKTYDVGRRPDGVNVIAALLQGHSGKSLKDLHVLDAGCGTGNYSRALLDLGVGQVTMIDGSEGMLSAAKVKVGEDPRASFQKAILPTLPFEDATFDAVMFNQVLHHLDNGSTGDLSSQVASAIKEASRVLKDGGMLSITTTLPVQIMESYWYTQFNRDMTQRYANRYSSIEDIQDMTEAASLSIKVAVSILNADWFELYRDSEGPLRSQWRDNDSFWSLATKEELDEILNKISQLKKDGNLVEFMNNHDKSRSLGSSVLVLAVKRD